MLIRWTPFNELSRLTDFYNFLDTPTTWNPAFDVTEDRNQIVLEADLPGIAQEDLDIQINQRVLTVKGTRKILRAETKDGYRHRERMAGSFERTFTLPDTIDGDQVTASLKDGVLRLTMPKKPEAQPRQIKILGE